MALHNLATAEVAVALKVGGRILDVGEQERDIAAELLLQEIIEFSRSRSNSSIPWALSVVGLELA